MDECAVEFPLEDGEFLGDFRKFILTHTAQAAEPFFAYGEFLRGLEVATVRRVFEPAVFRNGTGMFLDIGGGFYGCQIAVEVMEIGACEIVFGLEKGGDASFFR